MFPSALNADGEGCMLCLWPLSLTAPGELCWYSSALRRVFGFAFAKRVRAAVVIAHLSAEDSV